MFPVEWRHRKSVMNARPHPGTLPRGEGESSSGFGRYKRTQFQSRFRSDDQHRGDCNEGGKFSSDCNWLSLSLGESAGVRADVKSNLDFRPRWMFTRRHPLEISKKQKFCVLSNKFQPVTKGRFFSARRWLAPGNR